MTTFNRLWKYIVPFAVLHFTIWLGLLFFEFTTLISSLDRYNHNVSYHEPIQEKFADALFSILEQPGNTLLAHINRPGDFVFFLIMISNSILWGSFLGILMRRLKMQYKLQAGEGA